MEPSITTFPESILVGIKATMSVANMQQPALWGRFMPQHGRINHRVGADFYSVSQYPDVDYFVNFSPTRSFVNWAAVAVRSVEQLPECMEALTIPAGQYAVFNFKGTAKEVGKLFQHVYGTWLPQSGYALEQRPHMAIMPPGYRPDDPEAKETIWVPITSK